MMLSGRHLDVWAVPWALGYYTNESRFPQCMSRSIVALGGRGGGGWTCRQAGRTISAGVHSEAWDAQGSQPYGCLPVQSPWTYEIM